MGGRKSILKFNQSFAMRLFLLWSLLLLSSYIIGQNPITFPENGVYDEREGHYAFTNATIYVTPSQKLEKATLLIKKGKVIQVGTAVTIPKDAVVMDLQGKYIYPSFIELYSNYGMPKAVRKKRTSQLPQMLSSTPGAYSWNETIKPEQKGAALWQVNAKQAKEWRSLGFGTVLTHQTDGMARGSGTLVALGEGKAHDLVFNGEASTHYSFSKGTSQQNYPSSRMGAIALLRQTYYDAQWYAAHATDQTYNISLERWNALQGTPQFFEVGNRLDLLRADKIGDEFGVQYIIRGGGDAFLRLDAIKATKAAILVPLAFPKPYDVTDPYDAEEINLTQMKYWELAPTNPARLSKAGVSFALTTSLTKDKKDFWKFARKAYQHGLSEQALLEALTTVPARLIKADNYLGTLEAGKWANFIITSDNILQEKMVIYHNWVKGKGYVIKDINNLDIRGAYNLTVGTKNYGIDVKGTATAPELYLRNEQDTSKNIQLKHTLINNTLTFTFVPEKDTSKKIQETYRMSGNVSATEWSGQATDSDGNWKNWKAVRTGDVKGTASKLPELVQLEELGGILYPWCSYGYTSDQLPKLEKVLIKNATVWTGEKKGTLTNTDVLLEGGKISKIGKNLSANGAKVIDGTGKHLTAGIIDEHSHICINYGVNEGTQVSSAEVRIGDVINSEDVNMYRQLAGGVTGAQLLHGSANPIGGQSAVIKFRWGSLPEEIKNAKADGFIKFALGENVKQSNWGPNARTRFPQTRMGVEQVYEDYFTRAKEYGLALKAGKPVRRDLDLETVLEILNKERFISCHSYVQSEITMLMRIAEKYGFRLNTFTHILEGYKIADKMKEHGAGASTFSDWWAYKYEVIDAIPYNANILNEMGLVVAINSDDAEMGRRLNQEAAKAVKYGGMSEADAWKMVTHNPAKLLHLDDHLGSIKVGKDADVVLWSNNPLSVYARAEKTFVDGVCLFDLEEDTEKRQAIKKERNRLIQKMLTAKATGEKTQSAMYQKEKHYHCGDADCNNFVDYNVDVNGLDVDFQK
ncbi:MAG: amidohydrolase family protein [Aureispira sp.]